MTRFTKHLCLSVSVMFFSILAKSAPNVEVLPFLEIQKFITGELSSNLIVFNFTHDQSGNLTIREIITPGQLTAIDRVMKPSLSIGRLTAFGALCRPETIRPTRTDENFGIKGEVLCLAK